MDSQSSIPSEHCIPLQEIHHLEESPLMEAQSSTVASLNEDASSSDQSLSEVSNPDLSPGNWSGPAATPENVTTSNLASSPQHGCSYQPPSSFVNVKPWVSPYLWVSTTAAILALTVLTQGALIFLVIYSKQHQGIATVKEDTDQTKLFTFVVGQGIYWTFIPALFFQAYGMLYAAVVKAACARQPYVELAKDEMDGAKPEKSILLDYSSWTGPYAFFKALRLGHFMLAAAFVVSGLMQFVLGPIGSHLFDTFDVSGPRPLPITRTSRFDEGGFDVRAAMGPVLDVVSAMTLFHAPSIPWVTDNASLMPFQFNATISKEQVANITTTTQSYHLELDCRVLVPPQFILRYDDDSQATLFSATDRGCSYGGPQGLLFSTSNSPAIDFAQTYRATCHNDGGSTRILVALANRDDLTTSKFSNASVVSCLPTYTTSNGTAILSVTAAGDATLKSYVVDESTTTPIFDPLFASTFESAVCQTSILGQDLLLATRLGQIILDDAQSKSPGTYLRPENQQILVESVTSALKMSFNAMVQRYLIKPNSQAHNQQSSDSSQATIDLPQIVLKTIPPVAYTILGILFLSVVTLIWIQIYTRHNLPGQFEDSEGLVGAAVTMHGCEDISDMIKQEKKLRKHDGCVGTVVANDIKDAAQGWKFSDWPNVEVMKIVSTQKARR